MTEEEIELLNKCGNLEAENEELKEALKNDKVCKCSHYFNFKDLEAELTKAKEIIKDLLGSENQYCEEEMFFTIRKRAEDFIKE